MIKASEQKRMLVIQLSRISKNKLFHATANIQLLKFRFKEGAKLVEHQSQELISFIYSILWEASLWSITLIAFSNAPKSLISKDVF